jgi:hypothetical protein
MRVQIPDFTPQSRGLRFANSFPSEPDLELDLPHFGTVKLGDAAKGLCGGMSFTVADLYTRRSAPPEDPDPPDGGTERFNYLVRRQIDTLGEGRLPARFVFLMSPLRPVREGSAGIGHSRTYMMIHEEWPKIQADLDQGNLAMIGLVKTVSVDPRMLNKNHQVLAYGYDLDGSDLRLLILDPNIPRTEIELRLDIADPLGETHVTYGPRDAQAPDTSVVCFFQYPYAYVQPTAWISGRPDD